MRTLGTRVLLSGQGGGKTRNVVRYVNECRVLVKMNGRREMIYVTVCVFVGDGDNVVVYWMLCVCVCVCGYDNSCSTDDGNGKILEICTL